MAVCRQVLNKTQCVDLSAGTEKRGRCQREVVVSGGSTTFYLSVCVRTLPMLILLIFEVGS